MATRSAGDAASPTSAAYPWLAEYPAGVPADLPAGRALSLPELLAQASAQFGGRPALSQGDRTWSYAELQELVSRVADGLEDLGVVAGDRVAVMMPNHPAIPVWFFAAATLGAALVSINALYAADAVEHMLRDSGAAVLLALDDAGSLARLQRHVDRGLLSRIIAVDPDPASVTLSAARRGEGAAALDLTRAVVPFAALLASGARRDGHQRPSLDAGEVTAALQYTGGTTGVPKGAMLTHGNLSTNSRQMRAWFPFLEDGVERILIPLPFSHVTGISVAMVLAVSLAAELVIVPRFTPDEGLELLRRHRPTFFGGVPTVFTGLLLTGTMTADDWRSVKGIICGGAPLPPASMDAFEAVSGVKVRQIYGSTELSPAATLMPATATEPRTSVGLPLPGTLVEIRSTTDPHERLPPGESGEIVVGGPQVMKGYWKREDETKHFMVDGLFRTGDIGYLDARGFLFVIDRLKDMIIAGGYNVYPVNVEKAVYTHPAVAEAMVLGVPDEYRGETIKAFVVVRAGAKLTLAELQAHLKDQLSPIEMPRQLELLAELPRTAVGKLSRLELKRQLAERAGSAS